ncbi:L,D-transpeptidase family protein [Pontibacter lucknowensis]|uniref:Putative peptidoglycan binding domain-containing protein n=2 Tax=Pontibacter TaxID=323449 RepID=A0A1N6ZB11_9BACT|nr:L,D-transpeptidase family protein [Pontibacter lucknowensis]SIR24070.1 Putative peptidoglycan binding domain-containing protein [Pontibacter lucknowensis]
MARLLFIVSLFLYSLSGVASDSTEVWLLVPDQKEQLRQAITHYQGLSDRPWHTFPDKLLLRPGDSSRHTPNLRANLLLTGDLADSDTTDNSMLYTREIAAAVVRFQARHALKADSIVGPRTVAALNVPPLQRLRQLQNSLYRWEAFSRDLPQPYIIVNIPDYTLRLIDQNSVQLYLRTIVGKPNLPTIVNHTKLHTIVFNPYWYIPNSIASKEILPLLKRNPGYLKSRDMELFKPKLLGGWQKISPWDVDWSTVSASDFNYRIVQVTGPHNELGQMKFLFDTRVSQYLHDTKDKHLFSLEKRAFSHGCIRLQNPEDLALYLLQERSGLSENRIEKVLASDKDEQFIRLKKPVPLIIVYMTAWADEFSVIQFREDIYGYDSLEEIGLGQ